MTAAHVLSPEYMYCTCSNVVLTPTAAVNKRLQLYNVHMLSYYEEVQTHPLNLFQYTLLKYFLRCQFIKNISDPAQ